MKYKLIRALKPSRVARNPPIIIPDQLIYHSACDNYDVENHLNWQYSQGLESTYYTSGVGDAYQIMEEWWRAQANYTANGPRANGTGAISVETGSSINAEEPWTDQQVPTLIALGRDILARNPRIARRICRSPTDPGIGFHTMWGAPSAWTPVAKTCPGPARKQQFYDVIAPGILSGVDPKPPVIIPADDEEETMLSVVQCNQIDYAFSKTTGVFFMIRNPEHYQWLTNVGFINVPHTQAPVKQPDEIEFIRAECARAAGLHPTYQRVEGYSGK